MKIACKAGLAREIDFGDGNIKYEPLYGHEHYDHLVCMKCSHIVEIVSDNIEKEQKKIAEQHNFKLIKYRHILYDGICKKCS